MKYLTSQLNPTPRHPFIWGAALTILIPSLVFANTANLKNAIFAYKNRDYQTAAIAFYDAYRDRYLAPYQTRSIYFLANSLFHLNLRYPSLKFLLELVKNDSQDPYFFPVIKKAVILSQQQHDFTDLVETILKHKPARLPGEYRDLLNFKIASYLIQKQKLKEAFPYLKQVQANSIFFRRAKYLMGIIAYRQNKLKKAIFQLKELIEIHGFDGDRILEDQTILALARIFYALGKYDHSLKLYALIPKNSKEWATSLYEATWALFMIGNYNRALGHLHTLHSPFFEELDFPELYVINSVIYFNLCLYDLAQQNVKLYHENYDPVNAELKEILNQYGKNFRGFARFVASDALNKTNPRITAHLHGDTQFTKYRNLLIESQKQYARLNQDYPDIKSAQLGVTISKILSKKLDTTLDHLGMIVYKKLKVFRRNLSKFSTQADLVKFEALNKEKRALVAGIDNALSSEMKAQDALFEQRTRHSAQYYYWPFNQEYWIDELGDYEFSYKNQCRTTQ